MTAVLREIILTLVYFHKMAPLLISLITNNTVAVLEIHLTNPLWFMATESLTNKVSLWRDPTHLDSPSRLVQPRQGMNGVMDNRHGINILWHGKHRSKNQVYFTLHILELPE